MVSKENLRELIQLIKDATGLGQEEISIEAGYKSRTLTEILSKGNRLDSAYKRLELIFADRLKKTMSKDSSGQHFTPDQLFHMYMKAMERQDKILESQTIILKNIENKMAREKTLADVQSSLNDLLERGDDFEAQVLGAIHRASERFVGTEDPKQVLIEIDRISRLAGAYHADNLKKGKRVRRST